MTNWRIPIARPQITDADRAAVDAALASGQLSRGPAVAAFETGFRERLGCGQAVAVASGTQALTLGTLALEPVPRRAVTTPFTVPATFNALRAAGLEVVFVDIDPASLGPCPRAVEATLEAGDLLVPVHAFGHPAPMPELARLCEDRGGTLVEDSCEALGTVIEGRPAGTLGRFGIFGFYPNKQITTGEGGMLVTDDADLAARVRKLRNHGRVMDGRWFDQDGLGFNARLSELAAALGASQLVRLDEMLAARRHVAAAYDEALAAIPGLRRPADRPGYPDTALFAYVIELPPEHAARRDAVLSHLATAGVQAGRYFAPLHGQPGLRSLGYEAGAFPITERVASSAVTLPFYTDLAPSACDEVAALLRESL